MAHHRRHVRHIHPHVNRVPKLKKFKCSYCDRNFVLNQKLRHFHNKHPGIPVPDVREVQGQARDQEQDQEQNEQAV
jgi:hypothetical protein